ncbi:hypothetical protein RCL1_006017 [Eukaryota sp. TZLM3-RCL]
MDLNTFKRLYSNEDDTKAVMEQFLNEFDFNTGSVWFCRYLYNEGLTGPSFIAANRIGGFFQRSEHLLKDHFASVVVIKDPSLSHLSLTGFWILPGQEPNEKLRDVVDFESYKWEKADPTNPEHRQEIIDLACWTEPHHADGKILK